MIEAVLLALGLVTGPFHVVVEVDPASPPHRVEILLDGEQVAEVTETSVKAFGEASGETAWEARFDLGHDLTPHELVVISRDAENREIDRETRWLNLHVPAEARRRVATPVAVLLDHPRKVPEDLKSWFEVDGRSAEVLAVSYPDAEVWIVRDPKTQIELERAARLAFADTMAYGEVPTEVLRAGPEATSEFLAQSADFVARARHRFRPAWDQWQELFSYGEGTEVRYVSPWGAPVSQIERPRQIFGSTSPLEMQSRGLLYYTFATRPLASWFRLADAVGIAGLESTAKARRRAVVLLTADPDFPDESLYAPSQVRRLLAELGVPLFVWSYEQGEPRTASHWGPARPAAPLIVDVGMGYLGNVRFEHVQLTRTLERQRIVWIRGHHLPGAVTLRPEAEGVRLVSSVDSWPLLEDPP